MIYGALFMFVVLRWFFVLVALGRNYILSSLWLGLYVKYFALSAAWFLRSNIVSLFLTLSELVLTQGHDKSADYWAYGVLLYEMICNRPPFDSSNQQRTFEKIVHSQKHLSFPPDFNPHCKSLIRRLLHPNAALRLGALQNGIDDIKNHAFFSMQNLDFSKLLAQEYPMAYIPPVFIPGEKKQSAMANSIDGIDLEFEKGLEDDEDLNAYFENLTNTDEISDETWPQWGVECAVIVVGWWPNCDAYGLGVVTFIVSASRELHWWVLCICVYWAHTCCSV